MARRAAAATVALVVCLAAGALPVAGQISKENVLLIVNLDSADSVAIRDAYRAKHGSDVKAWQYRGSMAASVSRLTFNGELKDPLDAYLKATEAGQTEPRFKTIRVLVTTKGVPRRVWDIDGTDIGDDVEAMVDQYKVGAFDAAAVDSELALLHQPLSAGASPLPSNYANNHVRNPYHGGAARIDTWSRAYADVAKDLVFEGAGWVNAEGQPVRKTLTPGDIYLVTRLSGYTVAEAVAAINRAGVISHSPTGSTTVLDRDGVSGLDWRDPYSLGEDYPRTRDVLKAAGLRASYDTGPAFLTTADRSVLGYAGYGVNHIPGPGRMYVLNSLAFTLAPGAVFNTYESFNGRDFESADPNDPNDHDEHSAQVADWLRIGGTLGFGHVFEPLAFSVADNEVLYHRLLAEGWTFAEAAYASLPVLSWQNVVVGDPLACFEPTSEATAWQVRVRPGGGAPAVTSPMAADPADPPTVEPRVRPILTLLATFSKEVDPATVGPGIVTITGLASGDQSALLGPLALDAGRRVLEIPLVGPLPDRDTYTVHIAPTVRDTDGQPFGGYLTATFHTLVGDVDGSRAVTAADMHAVRVSGSPVLAPETARFDVDNSGRISGADVLTVRSNLGRALP